VFIVYDTVMGLCMGAWLGSARLAVGRCCNIAFERRNVFVWISYLLLMNLLSATLRLDNDESRKVVPSPPVLAC
jgi:hypothetical protein